MSLDNVLQKLRAVRTKLNISVQQKGVDIPDNSTLYTIDKGINQIQQGEGGSSIKFYKCASVTQAAGSSSTEVPSYVVAFNTEHELSGTYNYIGSNFVCLEDSTFNGAVWLRDDGGKALIKADNGMIYAGDIFQVNRDASTFGGFVTHAMSTQNEAPVQGDMLVGINSFSLFNAMYMYNNVIITRADKLSYVITGDTSASSVNGTYNYIGQFYSTQQACYVHMWHQEGGNHYIVEDPQGYYIPTFITDSVDGLDTGANKSVETIGMPAVYYVDSSLYRAYETNSPVALVDSIQFTPLDSSREAITCVKKVEEAAPSSWAGYEMQQDAEGYWGFSQTVTEQLEIKGFSPQVGTVYSLDTTIQIFDYIRKPQSDQGQDSGSSQPPTENKSPYGYRLKMSHYDVDPVWVIEFIQDDLTATGKARTWTCVEDSSQKLMYIEDFGGWTQAGIYDYNNYEPTPNRTGFGTGDDPYPCYDDMGVAEITVIE